MNGKALTVFFLSFLFFASIVSTSAMAQVYPLTISVDPKSGSPDNEYRFTATWDTNVGLPGSGVVYLQYKKNSDSTWKTFGEMTLLTTYTASGTQRQFEFTPSAISEIPTGSQDAGFSEIYDFRVRDSQFLNSPYSNVVTIPFSSGCDRGATATMRAVPSSGYEVSGKDVTVPINEGSKLGSGKIIKYELTVDNRDDGCGGSSTYLIEAEGDGVERSDREDPYEFEIKSSSPLVLMSPESSGSPKKVAELPAGQRVTFDIHVEANNDLAAGAMPFGVVTMRATNLDARNEGNPVTVTDSGRITVGTVDDCVRNDPTVKVEPFRRDGHPGQEVSYLVTVENEDTGHCTRTMRIDKVGVQKINQRNPDGVITTIEDQNSKNWDIKILHKPGGTGSTVTADPSSSGEFSINGNEYARFPVSGVEFTLGSFESTSNVKKVILKATSSTGETKDALKTIAVCVNIGNECGTATYNVLNPFNSEKPADTSNAYNDILLLTPDATPISGGTPSTGTDTPSTGSTPVGTPSGIDPEWFSRCKLCTLQAWKGLNTDTGLCGFGTHRGSTDSRPSSPSTTTNGKATIGNNWIYFPLNAAKNLILASDSGARQASFTCESPPEGVGRTGSSSTTVQTGLTCTECVAQPQMGYVTTTGKCEPGDAQSSDISSASAFNDNWVYFSTNTIRDAAATSFPLLYGGTYSCESPPSGSTSTSNTDSSSSSDTSSNTGSTQTGLTCTQCVSQFKMGYVTTTGKCEPGDAKSSDISSASAANNNWVYFSQDAIRDSAASSYPELYDGTYSCENPPSGSGSSNTDTSDDTQTRLTCLECVAQPNMGYVTTNGNCEPGNAQSSDISSASAFNDNWVYFSTDIIRDAAANSFPLIYGGTYSCESPPGSGSSGTDTSNNNQKEDCLECVSQFKMGYVTTTGACESGDAKSSDVSSASAANGNWIYFSQDVIRDSAARSYPELYDGTYSCDILN